MIADAVGSVGGRRSPGSRRGSIGLVSADRYRRSTVRVAEAPPGYERSVVLRMSRRRESFTMCFMTLKSNVVDARPPLRRCGFLVAAMVFVGALAGCSSSSPKGTATSKASSVSAPSTTLGETALCAKVADTQTELADAMKSMADSGASVAIVVTKLDPIREKFANLAKSTSDQTLARTLKDEAGAINAFETSSGSADAVGTKLQIDIQSLQSECAKGDTPLQTVPKNLSIPAG